MRLEAERVSYAVSGRAVLREVDVAVEPGVALALIGANGAGKTTLLRLLAGLVDADGGSIRLGGRDIGRLSRRELAQAIAVVAQGHGQVFAYSALELVLMGAQAGSRRWSLASRAEVERAEQAIARFELGALRDRAATALSGGEYQRVMLARAWATPAPIWLWDEPVANLDFRHQLLVMEQMRAHVAGGGSVCAVMHDLDLVGRYFDRVVGVHDAGLSEAGSPETIMTPDRLAAWFDIDFVRGAVAGHPVWLAQLGDEK